MCSHSASERSRSSIFFRFERSFSSRPISYTNVSTNYDSLAWSLVAWNASHIGRIASACEVITYVEDQHTAMSSRSWWTIFTPPCFWMLMKSCLCFAEERAYQQPTSRWKWTWIVRLYLHTDCSHQSNLITFNPSEISLRLGRIVMFWFTVQRYHCLSR